MTRERKEIGGASGRGDAESSGGGGPSAARVLWLVSGALVLASCGLFSAPQREEARAVVTADRDADVRVVTSRHFALSADDRIGSSTDVTLDEADTTVAAPPFDRTFDISDTRRFFIRVEPTDTLSVLATLEVFIDGESLGQLSGDLQDEPLQDVFVSVEF